MMWTPSHYYGPSLVDKTEFESNEELARDYRLTIEWRGTGHPDRSVPAWAICCRGQCYNRAGELDMEPLPSSRTDEWKQDHRFTFNEAQRLILEHWETWQKPILSYFRRAFGEGKS